MSNGYTLIELLSLLELDEYISFDLETTGLDPNTDRITEISACRFVKGEYSEEFTTLVNPEIPIPKNIISLTGITNNMVKDAPVISDVLPDFINFIGTIPLVGHNIDFDYCFLSQNISITDFNLPDSSLYDTLSLARSFIYFHNSFSLGSLCDYYGITIENAHRAGADALSTGEAFLYLIQEVSSRPLTLIQRIENLISNSQVYNHKLFSNIIKASVRTNKIDGLIQSPSHYHPPDNSFEYNGTSQSNIPDQPEDWFRDKGAIPSNWEGYEKRSSQTELITDAYKAFTDGEILQQRPEQV